ncbi:MAG: hypothetical protein ACT4O5_02855 [Gammaproteobacteria bacterium]
MFNMRSVLTMIALGSLLAACGEAGSADGEEKAADFDVMLFCGEARGSILALTSMTSRRARVNTSWLEYGEDHLGRLADQVSAPAEVRQDIARMGQSAQTWLDGIRAIPPNIVEGRLIEPDTSALDEKVIGDMRPVGERLSAWVFKVCGNP